MAKSEWPALNFSLVLRQAVLRSIDTKQGLVESGHLDKKDLTVEDQRLPGVLSVIMVLASVGIPFGIMLWNCFDHAAEKDGEDDDDSDGGVTSFNTRMQNPLNGDSDEEDSDEEDMSDSHEVRRTET